MIIRLRLTKAREDLLVAQEILQSGHWRAAVNRAYYGVFHIASAALLWHDTERRKHSAVEASFNQVLIKPGFIEREYSHIYKAAREWREDQDYSDFARPLDQPTANQIVEDAERFINRLDRYLSEVGAITEA